MQNASIPEKKYQVAVMAESSGPLNVALPLIPFQPVTKRDLTFRIESCPLANSRFPSISKVTFRIPLQTWKVDRCAQSRFIWLSRNALLKALSDWSNFQHFIHCSDLDCLYDLNTVVG